MRRIVTLLVAMLSPLAIAHADEPSAFGSGFDLQDFFLPFTIDEITPQNMQSWPYGKHVSANWDEFSIHGTAKVNRSKSPAKLRVGERLDANSEFRDGQTYLESFQATQVKGFVVMKDNEILAEFYDNGFNVGDTNLLQSAAKSFAGVITHQLIDAGKLDADAEVEDYLKDFKGTDIGKATVQQVLDMTSGLPTLLDLHTPGAPGQIWEVAIGLQAGEAKSHRDSIKSEKAVAKPGKVWNYTDMNTDTLALLAEQVTGRPYVELLSELFDAFGANDDGSIALTSDGTTSPCYGLSISTRDYALFHQWIAQGKAPASYYASVTDARKTLFQKNEVAALLGKDITYGSQSYYLKDRDIIYSSGSFGQIGYSDMRSGVAVVIHSDWAVNWELDKGYVTRDRAMAIIDELRNRDALESFW